MIRKIKIGASILLLSSVYACSSADHSAIDSPAGPVIPVHVVVVSDSSLTETIDITAVSAYLEKSFIKANVNGYVQSSSAQTGKQVGSGTVLFTLITKEAKAIGNSINKLDPSLNFSGVSKIRADQSGLIVQVNHQNGDYVQDGEALATISNRNSLVFLLDLPYEYNQLISTNKNISIELPDGKKLKGVWAGTMQAVDSLAQTARYIIKTSSSELIPAGLVAKVKLVKVEHSNTQVLPKSAVLSNETEESFWVMKMINDSIAVKVIVKKGLESGDRIELLSPRFAKGDRIISVGNYGIADTAKVKIQY